MKKILPVTNFFAMILVIFTYLISCEKNGTSPATNNNPTSSIDTVPEPDIQGNPTYTGTWTGKINVDDVGFCTYTGDPIEVTQEWTVSADGSVVIDETSIEIGDPTEYKFRWEGLMYNQDSVALTLNTTVHCFGIDTVLSVKMNAKINATSDNKYELKAIVAYPMCPPDCLFDFKYLMNKPI